MRCQDISHSEDMRGTESIKDMHIAHDTLCMSKKGIAMNGCYVPPLFSSILLKVESEIWEAKSGPF